MKAAHYITIAVAVTLIALLYWGGNTIPPAKKPGADKQQANAGQMAQGPNTMKPASFDSLNTASIARLPKTAADTVKTIENELAAIRDSSRMAVVFYKLFGVWGRNKFPAIANFYSGRAAKLEKSGKKLTFAGQIFLELMQNEQNASVQLWEAQEAVSCLELSGSIDPTNEETKLALATAYIEGTKEPMRGVQILRDITAQKPDDVPANMLLGRMSIQSGQFDKAVKRFETVLNKEPENKEALYFAAQAYEGAGDKKKAIELLEKCKVVVNDPQFSKDVDAKINTLK